MRKTAIHFVYCLSVKNDLSFVMMQNIFCVRFGDQNNLEGYTRGVTGRVEEIGDVAKPETRFLCVAYGDIEKIFHDDLYIHTITYEYIK